MARYKSILQLQGSIQDVTYTKDGVAKRKTTLAGAKWKAMPAMALPRKCAQAFGGASACAGAIVRQLTDEMRALMRPRAHNHIAGCLRKERTDRYTFEEAIPALHRLHLGRADGQGIQVQAIGHPLQPQAIHVHGLAAATPKGHDTDRLQLRISMSFVTFPERFYCPDGERWTSDDPSLRDTRPQAPAIAINNEFATHQPSSGWVKAAHLPADGITIGIEHPDPRQHQILFLAVEWRLEPTGSRQAQSAKASRQPKEAGTQAAQTPSLPPPVVCVAALMRSTATLHLPLPACMQATSPRRYKLKACGTRQPMPATLALRLAMPMRGNHRPDMPTPAHIHFFTPTKTQGQTQGHSPLSIGYADPPRRILNAPQSNKRVPKSTQQKPSPSLSTLHEQTNESPKTKATKSPQTLHSPSRRPSPTSALSILHFQFPKPPRCHHTRTKPTRSPHIARTKPTYERHKSQPISGRDISSLNSEL